MEVKCYRISENIVFFIKSIKIRSTQNVQEFQKMLENLHFSSIFGKMSDIKCCIFWRNLPFFNENVGKLAQNARNLGQNGTFFNENRPKWHQITEMEANSTSHTRSRVFYYWGLGNIMNLANEVSVIKIITQHTHTAGFFIIGA